MVETKIRVQNSGGREQINDDQEGDRLLDLSPKWLQLVQIKSRTGRWGRSTRGCWVHSVMSSGKYILRSTEAV